MELYPVNIKLHKRRCAVIGGGAVAERKVKALLEAGAEVNVISPVLTPGISGLQEDCRLSWLPRAYQTGDLENFFFVFCATDDPGINRQAAQDAKAAGALVNCVDDPELSDFYVPAHIAHGDLLLTVSTGGGSPALARRLREELAARYGAEYGHYLDLVAKLRIEMKERLATSKERENFWRRAIDQETLDLLKQGRFTEAEERMRNAACSAGPES